MYIFVHLSSMSLILVLERSPLIIWKKKFLLSGERSEGPYMFMNVNIGTSGKGMRPATEIGPKHY